jgi:tetratricopeptide (TPR) repeat protein
MQTISAIADWVRATLSSLEWLAWAGPMLEGAPDWALVIPAPIIFLVIVAWSVGRAKKSTEEAIDTLREGASVLTGGAIRAKSKSASEDQVKLLEAKMLALSDAQRAQVMALEAKLDAMNQVLAASGAASAILVEERQRRNLALVDVVSEDSAGARAFAESVLEGAAPDFNALKEEARRDAEKAASKWRLIAALALGVSDGDALAAYEEVNRIEPGDFWTLVELSHLYTRYKGALVAASAVAAEAKEVAKTDWERASAHELASELLRLRGDFAGALREAEAGLVLRDKIYLGGNVSGLSNIAVSRSNLAHIQGLLGDLDNAKANYERALEIAEKLAREKWDFETQHNFWVSKSKLADFMLRMGQTAEARPLYEDALAFAQRLAETSPDRAAAKRALLLSTSKLGQLEVRQKNWAQARPMLEEALDRAEALAKNNPESAEGLRDISVSAAQLANVLLELGDLEAARAHYKRSLAMREALAARDATNVQAQTDLAFALELLGELEMKAKDLDAAKEYTKASVAITGRIAAGQPENAVLQRDYVQGLLTLGDVQKAAGDLEGAGESYRQSLHRLEALISVTADNFDMRRDLVTGYSKLAKLYPGEGWWAKAHAEIISLADAGKLADEDAWMITDSELKAAADASPEAPMAETG